MPTSLAPSTYVAAVQYQSFVSRQDMQQKKKRRDKACIHTYVFFLPLSVPEQQPNQSNTPNNGSLE